MERAHIINSFSEIDNQRREEAGTKKHNGSASRLRRKKPVLLWMFDYFFLSLHQCFRGANIWILHQSLQQLCCGRRCRLCGTQHSQCKNCCLGNMKAVGWMQNKSQFVQFFCLHLSTCLIVGFACLTWRNCTNRLHEQFSGPICCIHSKFRQKSPASTINGCWFSNAAMLQSFRQAVVLEIKIYKRKPFAVLIVRFLHLSSLSF